MDPHRNCIAVDLDGTLAYYEADPSKPYDCEKIGKPIKPMVERVKQWLSEGKDVVIFSARAWPLGTQEETHAPMRSQYEDPEEYLKAHYRQQDDRTSQAHRAVAAIQKWCLKNIGMVLPVTCIKTPDMESIWDDRAVAVKLNQGMPLNEPQYN